MIESVRYAPFRLVYIPTVANYIKILSTFRSLFNVGMIFITQDYGLHYLNQNSMFILKIEIFQR